MLKEYRVIKITEKSEIKPQKQMVKVNKLEASEHSYGRYLSYVKF